ncbi:MAG: DUF2306 domain-containing protein [Novosphingobium sp.]|uniref:DUF2306 domain-containing protein n=1 Tax=Novosphingobium sp. TaxID=1874826 RepID=UPI003C7D2EA5
MTATTLTLAPAAKPAARQSFDISPVQRAVIGVVGAGFSVACTVAITRAIGGWAPAHPGAQELALLLHITAVVPAVPLGAWLLLTRKGTPRHKQLGKVWVALMVITALSALFIRQIIPGSFSPIHLFVPLALNGAWQTIATARRGDIAAHKRALVRFYLGALMIPGIFAFMPDRLMGTWLFG